MKIQHKRQIFFHYFVKLLNITITELEIISTINFERYFHFHFWFFCFAQNRFQLSFIFTTIRYFNNSHIKIEIHFQELINIFLIRTWSIWMCRSDFMHMPSMVFHMTLQGFLALQGWSNTHYKWTDNTYVSIFILYFIFQWISLD